MTYFYAWNYFSTSFWKTTYLVAFNLLRDLQINVFRALLLCKFNFPFFFTLFASAKISSFCLVFGRWLFGKNSLNYSSIIRRLSLKITVISFFLRCYIKSSTVQCVVMQFSNVHLNLLIKRFYFTQDTSEALECRMDSDETHFFSRTDRDSKWSHSFASTNQYNNTILRCISGCMNLFIKH